MYFPAFYQNLWKISLVFPPSCEDIIPFIIESLSFFVRIEGKMMMKLDREIDGKMINLFNVQGNKVINFNHSSLQMQIEKPEQKQRKTRFTGRSHESGYSNNFRKNNQSPYLQSILNLTIEIHHGYSLSKKPTKNNELKPPKTPVDFFTEKKHNQTIKEND